MFTLSNLYFIGCAYKNGFNEHWNQCLATPNWGVTFVIGTLPLLARLVQSVRRWADSKLVTHLINASTVVFQDGFVLISLDRVASMGPVSYII